MRKAAVVFIMLLISVCSMPAEIQISMQQEAEKYIVYAQSGEKSVYASSYFQQSSLREFMRFTQQAKSVTVCVQNSESAKWMKALRLRIVNVQNIAGRKIITAYSPILPSYVRKNGVDINIQISMGEDVLVGYPYIAESF